VPRDRAADRAAELEPIFAQLAATHRECERLVTQARVEAESLVADARDRARALVADASAQAPGERARVAAQAREEASATIRAVREAGLAEAAAVARRADERLGKYVEQVVVLVRRELTPDEHQVAAP
jgi:vacuolar-type H+-ATPase subunit H